MNEKTILLVEDNPDDEALMRRALRKHNIPARILVARDGVEAIDQIFRSGFDGSLALPAVIFLDLKMPRMDGFEVLRRLRADDRTRTVPVIIFTSSNESQDIRGGYELGANSYVRKPVDFLEFSESVRLLAEYWLRLNELPPVHGELRFAERFAY